MYRYANDEVKQSIGLSEKAINMIIEAEHASRPVIDIGCIQVSPLLFDYKTCEDHLKVSYKTLLINVLTELGGTVEEGINIVADRFHVNKDNKEDVSSCVRFFMSDYIRHRYAYENHKLEDMPTLEYILQYATE